MEVCEKNGRDSKRDVVVVLDVNKRGIVEVGGTNAGNKCPKSCKMGSPRCPPMGSIVRTPISFHYERRLKGPRFIVIRSYVDAQIRARDR